MTIEERSYQEYWGYYFRIIDRHRIPDIFTWDQKLVNLIISKCGLSSGSKVLDLGCGGGDQLKIFAQNGYDVVGIDYVSSLIKAAKEYFKTNKLKGSFIQEDMRSIDYKNEFNLCTLLSGSFGYFSDNENFNLLKRIIMALRPNGYAFINFLSAQTRSKMNHNKTWYEIENGFFLSDEWYDQQTKSHKANFMHIFPTNDQILKVKREPGQDADEIIRCYENNEIASIAKEAGFSIIGFLTNTNINDPEYIARADEPCDYIVLKEETA